MIFFFKHAKTLYLKIVNPFPKQLDCQKIREKQKVACENVRSRLNLWVSWGISESWELWHWLSVTEFFLGIQATILAASLAISTWCCSSGSISECSLISCICLTNRWHTSKIIKALSQSDYFKLVRGRSQCKAIWPDNFVGFQFQYWIFVQQDTQTQANLSCSNTSRTVGQWFSTWVSQTFSGYSWCEESFRRNKR